MAVILKFGDCKQPVIDLTKIVALISIQGFLNIKAITLYMKNYGWF